MITFGTDGWRDIIADNFTFANVRLAAKAVADHLLAEVSGARSPAENPAGRSQLENAAQSPGCKADERRGEGAYVRLRDRAEAEDNAADGVFGRASRVVVGYDTRFLSRQFAQAAAEVLAASGIKVYFTENFVPTPAVSFAVFNLKADGGIVITASHNPALYNGFKFKAAYGGSATPEIMTAIEERYLANHANGSRVSVKPFSDAIADGSLEIFNPEPAYFSHLKSLLNIDVFRDSQIKILIDPIYGSGQGYLRRLLGELGCRATEIRGKVLPTFGGVNPEPIEKNLEVLRREVVSGGYDVGLALDGDADRIGAVDESGEFVDSHRIFSLILKYLAGVRGMTGKVVKTVSTTRTVGRLAKKYGLSLTETPIGFKYICDEMLCDDVLIGGEESGGISVKGHIPERDGLLMGCLIAEVMLVRGKSLSGLLREIADEVGPAGYSRTDLHIAADKKENLIQWLRASDLEEIGGRKVEHKNFKDGFKFIFEGDDWLLLRPSGTEPVVRVYAEADSRILAESLVANGIELLREAGAL